MLTTFNCFKLFALSRVYTLTRLLCVHCTQGHRQTTYVRKNLALKFQEIAEKTAEIAGNIVFS